MTPGSPISTIRATSSRSLSATPPCVGGLATSCSTITRFTSSRSTTRPYRAVPNGCASHPHRCTARPISIILSARWRGCGRIPSYGAPPSHPSRHVALSAKALLETNAGLAARFPTLIELEGPPAYILVTSPTNTTGPVARSVGEPPGGSTVIASLVPGRTSEGSAPSRNTPSGGMTPSACGGVAPGAIAQSSKARPGGGLIAATVRCRATMRRQARPCQRSPNARARCGSTTAPLRFAARCPVAPRCRSTDPRAARPAAPAQPAGEDAAARSRSRCEARHCWRARLRFRAPRRDRAGPEHIHPPRRSARRDLPGSCFKTTPQRQQSAPHPAFDASQRRREAFRDLGMGKSIDKGQHHATPLPIVEPAQATRQRAGFGLSIEPFDHVGLKDLVAERRILGRYLATELADGVKRPKAHNASQPSATSTAFRVEVLGVLPDLKERVLQHVGGNLRAPDDAQGNTVKTTRFKLVEPLQCGAAAHSNSFDQDAGRGKRGGSSVDHQVVNSNQPQQTVPRNLPLVQGKTPNPLQNMRGDSDSIVLESVTHSPFRWMQIFASGRRYRP